MQETTSKPHNGAMLETLDQVEMLEPVVSSAILAGDGQSQRASQAPIGEDAVGTLHATLYMLFLQQKSFQCPMLGDVRKGKVTIPIWCLNRSALGRSKIPLVSALWGRPPGGRWNAISTSKAGKKLGLRRRRLALAATAGVCLAGPAGATGSS